MPANSINSRLIRLIKLWVPVLACMLTIFYFSSLPGKDIPSLFPLQDVFFHATIYAVLAWFFARALKNTYPKFTLFRLILFTLIFGIIYGASDEFHQSFVPGRDASGFDLFIDAVGTFIGSIFYR